MISILKGPGQGSKRIGIGAKDHGPGIYGSL